MRKLILPLLLLVLVGVQTADPAFAYRRVVVRHGPRRTVVVVRRGWPLRRPLRVVVVRPARVVYRVEPAVYLAPVVFAGVVVARAPGREVMVWEDGETLNRDDDWTQMTSYDRPRRSSSPNSSPSSASTFSSSL